MPEPGGVRQFLVLGVDGGGVLCDAALFTPVSSAKLSFGAQLCHLGVGHVPSLGVGHKLLGSSIRLPAEIIGNVEFSGRVACVAGLYLKLGSSARLLTRTQVLTGASMLLEADGHRVGNVLRVVGTVLCVDTNPATTSLIDRRVCCALRVAPRSDQVAYTVAGADW